MQDEVIMIDPRPMPWLDIAKMEKGIKEVQGLGNNPRIIEYHSTTKLKGTADSIPWCSAFVCWCLQKAGYKHTHSAAAISYEFYGEQCGMKLGAIAVFKREGGNHVGFIVAWDDHTVSVLGGNQSDAVNVKAYSREKLIATRWPVKDEPNPQVA